MDDLIGYLVVIGLVVAAIVAVVALLVSIGPFIAAAVLGVGFLWGSGVAVKNFANVLVEAHKRLP
jgi:hypothetical protein